MKGQSGTKEIHSLIIHTVSYKSVSLELISLPKDREADQIVGVKCLNCPESQTLRRAILGKVILRKYAETVQTHTHRPMCLRGCVLW